MKCVKKKKKSENIQLIAKLSQDSCRYANLAPTAEQKMSFRSLCYRREPANASQVLSHKLHVIKLKRFVLRWLSGGRQARNILWRTASQNWLVNNRKRLRIVIVMLSGRKAGKDSKRYEKLYEVPVGHSMSTLTEKNKYKQTLKQKPNRTLRSFES